MTSRVLLVGHSTSHEVLAGARELAGSGWEVHVATGATRSLAGASRSVRSEHRVCAPDVDVDGFVRGVEAALRASGAQVVVGCGDPELLALSASRDQLSARVPLAEHPVVLASVDKLTLARAAADVGLAVPHTVVADENAIATWDGPAVVKPRLHFDPAHPGSGWTSARVTRTRAELRGAADAVRGAGGEPVVQQFVQGDLIALSAVRDARGRLVALMQQRATHTWPPRAGVSARAVTVPVDPRLGSGVADLLDHLGWIGMVQVQLLQPELGPPRVLDLNGRPYGSLPLAHAAGLPLLTSWLGGGADTRAAGARPAGAREGVRYSRLGSDLQRAMTERRGGLVRDLSSTGRAWRGAAHPVADRSDVRPLMRLARMTVGETGRSAIRGAATVARSGHRRSMGLIPAFSELDRRG